MMWNWQLSALATGAEIVLYDGPVVDPDDLWRIVAEEHVTAFGTSPAFLRMCQDAGYSPRRRNLDLTRLRSIMSTGAILDEDQFRWTRNNVGPVPLQSISGGTDIVGCFVLGNSNLPVYAGESQCRSFGLDVRALVPAERPDGCIGDLICANPFPSRPLGIYGDSSGERFHAAYFSQHPGVWTHGDLIEITSRGTARMHGRSDGVLNVRGIRIGPAEIYRVLAAFREIQEAMVVEQPTLGAISDSRMVLLLVMNPGHSLDPPLRARIRAALARQASPAHVPTVIVDVPEIPVTHSGKRSEVAATEVLKSNQAANVSALRNPDSLKAIAARVAAYDARRAASSPVVAVPARTLEQELTEIWERVLGTSPISPHDNFFDIGGTSLLTAPLFQQIAIRLGRRLPLSTILHAPTIWSLAALLRDDRGEAWGPLELLKSGDMQHPLLIAPGLSGEPLGLRALAQHIKTERAVYGLRGRGLIDGEQPLDRVEDMAQAYLGSIRALQPRGPYSLLGFSLGGLVVFEIVRYLVNAGERVEFLGLIDTHLEWACLHWHERIAQALLIPLRWPRALTLDLGRNARRFLNKRRGHHATTGLMRDQHAVRVAAAGLRAQHRYRPKPYAGSVVYFKASVQNVRQYDHVFEYDPTPVWSRLTTDLTIYTVSGPHEDLIRGRVDELGRILTIILGGVAQSGEERPWLKRAASELVEQRI
jgi:acetoacetyl-CoA synthetase